jgi:hypothetical protein
LTSIPPPAPPPAWSPSAPAPPWASGCSSKTTSPTDANAQLAQVGHAQAQGSYFYRHAANTALFDTPGVPFVPAHILLDNLGLNRNGLPIRALAIDTQFLCSPALAAYNVLPSTHHRQAYADILFSDGHAATRPNTAGAFVVNLGSNVNPAEGFALILSVLERADSQP